MLYLKWSQALMALAMLLCLVTVGVVSTPSAHAAGVSTTTTKTSTFKASAQLCTFLQKSLPARAGDAYLCDITIIATDVITRKTGMQSAALSPNACYPVVINHTADYQYGWPFTVAEFYQSETFTYGCTPAPVVSNHRCYGLWTSGTNITLSPLGCYDYPNGYGHTQAEDDVYFNEKDGDHFDLEGYSDGQPNASIYDWCNYC